MINESKAFVVLLGIAALIIVLLYLFIPRDGDNRHSVYDWEPIPVCAQHGGVQSITVDRAIDAYVICKDGYAEENPYG